MTQQNRKPLSQIRSAGLAKINRLQRAAAHLDILRPAFAEWQAGDIYVCKKTGTFRYRTGDKGKSVAPWSSLAVRLFGDATAFAFAAMVLAPEALPALPAPSAAIGTPRVDVIALAGAAA